jgi:chromosome segregation ATPase
VDNASEQLLVNEKEKNRRLLSDNVKLIEKQKEQKKKYEELYQQYLICLKKLQKENDAKMDVCQDEESNEFDPKLVFGLFGVETEHINNNNLFNNNYFNCYSNTNLHANKNINSKTWDLNLNNNNNLQKAISDDSTREDYKNTYENCFKELERLQQDLRLKENILQEKNNYIESLHITIWEHDSSITLLYKKIEEIKQKNLKLCMDYKTGDSDLTAIMMKNSELENEIQKLKEIIEDNKKEIERNYQKIIFTENNFIKQIEWFKQDLEFKKKKVDEAQEENHNKAKTIKILETNLEMKELKIKELRETIETLENDKKIFKEVINELSKTLKKKEKEIEDLIYQKAEISEKGKELIKSYEESLENKEEEKVKIEEELKIKIKNYEDASLYIFNLKDSYCNIDNNLENEKKINLNFKMENTNLKKQVEVFTEKEKELKDKVEELTTDVSELTKNE